jgi:hypothetical protein
MSKKRRKYSILVTLCSVVAMVLVQSVTTSTPATFAARPGGFTDVDLKSEDGTLELFGDGSIKYDKQLAEFRRAASLRLLEIDGLKSKAEDIKRQVPQALQAVKSAIAKLKAADHWNKLDDEVLAGLDARVSGVLKKLGGPRQNLQEVSEFSSSKVADELDTEIGVLRARAVSRLENPIFDQRSDVFRIRAVNYNPVAALGFRCRLATARLTISKLTHGGHATAAASSNVLLSCPDPSLN